MEANELRIGNYVKVSTPAITCDNFRVDAIRRFDGEYVIRFYPMDDNDFYFVGLLRDAEPIPLTPELLERCGFKRDSKYVWIHDNPKGRMNVVNYDAPNSWDDTTDYPIEISGTNPLAGLFGVDFHHGEVVIRCLYLHDLQNKFYAITGKELDVKW